MTLVLCRTPCSVRMKPIGHHRHVHSLAERHMLSAATVPAAEYSGLKGCQLLHKCYLLPACQVVPMRSPRLLEQNLLKRVSLIFLQCFFGCTGPCTLDPCLGKCLPLHKRNGKGAYAGAFLDYLLGENAITKCGGSPIDCQGFGCSGHKHQSRSTQFIVPASDMHTFGTTLIFRFFLGFQISSCHFQWLCVGWEK